LFELPRNAIIGIILLSVLLKNSGRSVSRQRIVVPGLVNFVDSKLEIMKIFFTLSLFSLLDFLPLSAEKKSRLADGYLLL
jgi:hypothetical protein